MAKFLSTVRSTRNRYNNNKNDGGIITDASTIICSLSLRWHEERVTLCCRLYKVCLKVCRKSSKFSRIFRGKSLNSVKYRTVEVVEGYLKNWWVCGGVVGRFALVDVPRRDVRWSWAIINRDVTSWFVTLFWFGMQLRIGRYYYELKIVFPFMMSQAVTGRYTHLFICTIHENCFRMQAHKKLVSMVITQGSTGGPIL